MRGFESCFPCSLTVLNTTSLSIKSIKSNLRLNVNTAGVPILKLPQDFVQYSKNFKTIVKKQKPKIKKSEKLLKLAKFSKYIKPLKRTKFQKHNKLTKYVKFSKRDKLPKYAIKSSKHFYMKKKSKYKKNSTFKLLKNKYKKNGLLLFFTNRQHVWRYQYKQKKKINFFKNFYFAKIKNNSQNLFFTFLKNKNCFFKLRNRRVKKTIFVWKTKRLRYSKNNKTTRHANFLFFFLRNRFLVKSLNIQISNLQNPLFLPSVLTLTTFSGNINNRKPTALIALKNNWFTFNNTLSLRFLIFFYKRNSTKFFMLKQAKFLLTEKNDIFRLLKQTRAFENKSSSTKKHQLKLHLKKKKKLTSINLLNKKYNFFFKSFNAKLLNYNILSDKWKNFFSTNFSKQTHFRLKIRTKVRFRLDLFLLKRISSLSDRLTRVHERSTNLTLQTLWDIKKIAFPLLKINCDYSILPLDSNKQSPFKFFSSTLLFTSEILPTKMIYAQPFFQLKCMPKRIYSRKNFVNFFSKYSQSLQLEEKINFKDHARSKQLLLCTNQQKTFITVKPTLNFSGSLPLNSNMQFESFLIKKNKKSNLLLFFKNFLKIETFSLMLFTPLLFKFFYFFFSEIFFQNKSGSLTLFQHFKKNQIFLFHQKKNFFTNIFYDRHFIFFIKKYAIKSFSFYSLTPVFFAWHYQTMLKFFEFVTGKRIYFQVYSLLTTDLEEHELTRCILWSYRLKSFQRAFGAKLFLIESLKILYTALKYKDLHFLSNWMLNFFYKISFWKYKMIFRYLYYVLRYFFQPYLPEISVKGLKFQLKGKVSVAGNARTRTVRSRVGCFSHSTFSYKLIKELNLIRTFTGVIGFSTWLAF